jgi:hypothetical protein
MYWWTCERCGERLQPAGTHPYTPKYDPSGNDRFLTAAR